MTAQLETRRHSSLRKYGTQSPWPFRAAAAAIAVGAILAICNTVLARKAEQRHPAKGRFLNIDSVRLHYLEEGSGKPLLLLHGNGGMAEELRVSGLLHAAAEKYRVVAFDRPGLGHSTRPRDRVWSADAQADVIADALDAIGLERVAVFAHSWGTLVALSLANRHPDKVHCLILASGYYFPTPRIDALLLASSAVPIIGDILRFTIQPLVSRMIWAALVRVLFSPAPVPRRFQDFPRSMALRPSQLRAVGQESGMMISAAAEVATGYDRLHKPLTIIAGAGDRIVSPQQAEKLHRRVGWSRLVQVGGAGHMVHHTALAEVMGAIDLAMAKYG